jgi:hypothetical protein
MNEIFETIAVLSDKPVTKLGDGWKRITLSRNEAGDFLPPGVDGDESDWGKKHGGNRVV